MWSKEKAKLYRQANKAQHREHSRKYRKSHPLKVKTYNQKWRARNPDKVREINKRKHKKNYTPHPRIRLKYITSEEQTRKRKCRIKTQTAVKQGKLKKNACQVCGDPNVEAHHPDYSKPMEVVWLCRKDHLKAH